VILIALAAEDSQSSQPGRCPVRQLESSRPYRYKEGTLSSSGYEQRAQETLTAATGSGWVTFGGYLFFVTGIFHVIDGIAALSKAHVYHDYGLFANIRFWGVVMLIIGGLAIYAGWAVLDRQEAGRVIGIVLAGLGILAQLMFSTANEFWSLIMVAMWIAILYALIVHGNEFSRRST
jgi:hypothetical protein